ncbi:MAG TPA: CDP-alcohol phosphatidyltransferase family protein [Bryobacteraceae bacterium]|jgi:cardiolipin synthase
MKQIPNLLTGSRILAAPYLFWLLAQREWHTAVWLMLAISITDVADGYLARKLGASSRVGEVLDPIADKLLLGGSYLTLWWIGAIEGWLTAIVFGRDALILLAAGVAFLMSQKPRRFPPSVWGKLSTFCQISLVVGIVGGFPAWSVQIAKGVVATLVIVSTADYAVRYTRK